ncbi:MAG TPA: CoA-transferase [Burkholderiales bacterium]|nr:CoA-transferase [Burkholderiales bacterium]
MQDEPMVSLEALAAAVPDGALLAVPKDSSGVAMAATRELVRRGVRGLHLVCVPTGGIQADILIGAGAVGTIETSAVTMGEFGPAPRFTAAVRDASLRVMDATCPAVYAALQAGEKGIPFIPLRGLIGSDVLRHRGDWKVVDNPFDQNDPIALLPAIRPDVSLFHAPYADRYGNVFVGRNRDLMTMAHASVQTLVTVEELVDENLLEDPARAGSTLPAIYVSRIAVAKKGAWPLALGENYPDDEAMLSRYVSLACTADGFRIFLEDWLQQQRVAA